MNLIQIPKGPKYAGETGHPVARSDMGRKEIYLRESQEAFVTTSG